jgi:hypothetical protein
MISPAPLLPPKEHAFGVDDDLLYRMPVPSTVLGAGQFSQVKRYWVTLAKHRR